MSVRQDNAPQSGHAVLQRMQPVAGAGGEVAGARNPLCLMRMAYRRPGDLHIGMLTGQRNWAQHLIDCCATDLVHRHAADFRQHVAVQSRTSSPT